MWSEVFLFSYDVYHDSDLSQTESQIMDADNFVQIFET